MNVPVPAAAERVLLDADGLRRTLSRIAHEIIEGNPDLSRVALVGIQTRGVPLGHDHGARPFIPLPSLRTCPDDIYLPMNRGPANGGIESAVVAKSLACV